MKYDIKVAGNGIGGRQGFAYVCNSGEIKVIKANLEAPQEYEDYKEYGDANLEWTTRSGRVSYKTSTLCFGTNGWGFTSGGACLSASFGYYDAMEMIDNAQLQILREGDIVAIARYNSKSIMLHLFKLGKVSVTSQMVARLTELTDEEMAEVVKKANRWLDR